MLNQRATEAEFVLLMKNYVCVHLTISMRLCYISLQKQYHTKHDISVVPHSLTLENPKILLSMAERAMLQPPTLLRSFIMGFVDFNQTSLYKYNPLLANSLRSPRPLMLYISSMAILTAPVPKYCPSFFLPSNRMEEIISIDLCSSRWPILYTKINIKKKDIFHKSPRKYG